MKKTDYEIRQNLQQETRQVIRPQNRFWALYNSILGYLLRSIPFSVKIFLRRDIGSMTFGWETILFAALWFRFILDGYLDPSEFAPPDTMFIYFNEQSDYYWIVYPIWVWVMLFIQFGYTIINFIPPELYMDTPPSFFREPNPVALQLSFLIILIGWWHKYRVAKLHKKKVPFNPLHQGNNLVLEAIKWFLGLFGPKVYDQFLHSLNIKDLDWFSRKWEAAFLLLLSYTFYEHRYDFPDLSNFSWFFGIGAVALLIEGRILIMRKRREIEAQLATVFQAQRVQTAYQEYIEEKVQEVAAVTYVDSRY
ncbi:MAG: hypothetical protein AAF694_04215 [Bacteroidota bacterium]